MPLIKSPSPKAMSKNIGKEIAAGKPVKQAVAIAYAVKREAAKDAKPKKWMFKIILVVILVLVIYALIEKIWSIKCCNWYDFPFIKW